MAPAAPQATSRRMSERRAASVRPRSEPRAAQTWVKPASSPTEPPQPLETSVWPAMNSEPRNDRRPP